MKKVIAFALWGDLPIYVYGIFQNIRLAQRFYPDWICRFYVSEDCSKKIVNRIKEFGAEVRFEKWNKVKYFWRLKVILDRTVDKFMIRDTDSRIGMREKIAVQAWEKSDKAVHIMRDHKRHTMNIMGGMWAGDRKEFLRLADFKKRYDRYIERLLTGWRPRTKMAKELSCQAFLNKDIYPKVKDDALVHTSVPKRSDTDLPFPKECPTAGIDFVGQIYNEKNQPLCDLKSGKIYTK